MSLRDLDEKWVPRLAERLTSARGAFPKPAPPGGPLPVILRLRRIDDRWTAAGPLALIREVPQLGGFVLALIILVGGATAFSRDERPPRTDTAATPGAELPGEEPEEDDRTELGPVIGRSVDEYLAETKERLLATAPGAPDATTVAVVSFRQYETPEAVRDLLGTSMQVHKVFFRLPGPTGVVEQADVQDVVADTKRAFRDAAKGREREAAQLLEQAATIENDPAQKRFDEQQAALALRDAKALRGPCRCVFAVVVRARLRLLLDAQRVKAFRAIDIGRVGSELRDYRRYTALTPGEKVTITGGNQKPAG